MLTLGKVTVLSDDGLVSEELSNYLERSNRMPEYTQAQLEDSGSAANRDKSLGKAIKDVTNNRILWGGGSDLTSPWVDGSNTTVHTVT